MSVKLIRSRKLRCTICSTFIRIVSVKILIVDTEISQEVYKKQNLIFHLNLLTVASFLNPYLCICDKNVFSKFVFPFVSSNVKKYVIQYNQRGKSLPKTNIAYLFFNKIKQEIFVKHFSQSFFLVSLHRFIQY